MSADGEREAFEALLARERAALERYVRYRISDRADADDVLQEVCLAAYRGFAQLKDRALFKAWLIGIARNKCGDFFRRKAARLEIPVDALTATRFCCSRQGVSRETAVRETLALLGGRDKQILYLYYWKELPQEEIARRLGIPVGTVKSRLHTARENFRGKYPREDERTKGAHRMKGLPEYLPEYKIERLPGEGFPVVWEELMGWFLVPRLGERLEWGMYDMPSRRCRHVYAMEAVGRARVHGIEGVELTAREAACSSRAETIERTFVAQLTDERCRYLATMRTDDGVRNYITFLDEEFTPNWGYPRDNAGHETHLSPKGILRREGSDVTAAEGEYLLDIVGRYAVTLGGRRFDTALLMDVESPGCGVVTEQYLDRDGRTVLWRRFNRDDWALDQYKERWSRQLPGNERITVNGTVYVHWYDCVTERAL